MGEVLDKTTQVLLVLLSALNINYGLEPHLALFNYEIISALALLLLDC